MHIKNQSNADQYDASQVDMTSKLIVPSPVLSKTASRTSERKDDEQQVAIISNSEAIKPYKSDLNSYSPQIANIITRYTEPEGTYASSPTRPSYPDDGPKSVLKVKKVGKDLTPRKSTRKPHISIKSKLPNVFISLK